MEAPMKYLQYILLMLVFVGVAEGQTEQKNIGGIRFVMNPNGDTTSSFSIGFDKGPTVFRIRDGQPPHARPILEMYDAEQHGFNWSMQRNGGGYVSWIGNVRSGFGTQGQGQIQIENASNPRSTGIILDPWGSYNAPSDSFLSVNGGASVRLGGLNVSGGSVTARDGFSAPTGGVTSKFVKTDSLRTPMIVHDTSNVSGTDSIAWEIADLVIPRTLRYPYQGAAVYAKKFGKITFRFWHSGTTGIHEALWAADSANGVEVIGVDYVSREVMYGAGSQYFGPRSFFSFVSPGTVNAGSAIAGNSNNFFQSTIYAYPGAAAVSGRINITGSGDNSFYETEYTMTFRMPPGNASTWYVKLYDF